MRLFVCSFCVCLLLFARAAGVSAPSGKWCTFGNAFVATGRQHHRDFVDVGLRANEKLGRAMTLEAWIWSTEPKSRTWKTIVSRTPHFWNDPTFLPNPFTDFNFQVDNEGRLSFFMGNGLLAPFQYGILLRSPQPVEAQKWIHVAAVVESGALKDLRDVVFVAVSTQQHACLFVVCVLRGVGAADPLQATLYIDGELVDEDLWGEGTRQWSPEWPLRIGRYDNTDNDVQYWDGKLDEVRVWDYARSRDELLGAMFLALAPPPAGLVLYYQFETSTRDDQVRCSLPASLRIIDLGFLFCFFLTKKKNNNDALDCFLRRALSTRLATALTVFCSMMARSRPTISNVRLFARRE